MRFLNPEFLWLLLLLPLLALFRGRKGSAAALEYSSADLLRGVAGARKAGAGRLLVSMRLFVLALGVIALARPQFGHGNSEVEASGIDIVLALDVSGSMEALDFKLLGQPVSRIEMVKNVVAQFIKDRPNDRIAMIAFAGGPYLISPLTLDHDWLLQSLERVKIGIIEDSTAIGSAIAASVNRLRDQHSKSRIVVLLTDGMNNAGKIGPETAAEAARALGIKVYTIGIGVRGEAPIPVTDPWGQKRMMMMKVDVDEETLEKVAATTGAKFYRATDTDSLKNIYSQIDRMEKSTVKMKKFEHYDELFAWALIPGILALGMEMLLSQTRFRRLP